MVKTKEQYINDVLMDLFFLTEKKGERINKKKIDLIHQFYNDNEINALKSIRKDNPDIIPDDKWDELDKELKTIRKCYCNVFYKLCEMQKDIDEELKQINNSRKVIENHTLRCILETASYYYGMPRYEGRETRYRYITKTIYDETISQGKKISDFNGPIHYEHVVPMNELIKLLKAESQDFETFDKTMKEKMFVCCVSDKDNKKLNKNSMPKEKKEEWENPNANINDVWARYVTKGIQVYDLYKGKTILTIK